MATASYDVVIVGGGTAGLVLAARLSEDPNLVVAVLEAGEDEMSKPQFLTPAMWPLLANSSADWAFRTAPQEGLGGKELTFSQGRALGGSSALNSYLFTPTSKLNVDAWSQLGNKGWDWPTFEKSVRKSCTLHKLDSTTVGDGPVQLNVSDSGSGWTKVWTDTLDTLGFPLEDPFSGRVSGSLIIPQSVDPVKKQRSCSANTYLTAASTRANLTVLTGATATKILLESTSPGSIVAGGVQYVRNGMTETVKAHKEVVLAAGTINSPRLLELSGIGGSDLLRSLGIDVVIDNPYVGENLQNHVVTGVTFEIRDDEETLDPLLRKDPAATAAAIEAYRRGAGPLASSNIVASAQLPLPSKDIDELLSVMENTKHAQVTQNCTRAFASVHESFIRAVLTDPKEASGVYLAAPAYSPFDSDNPAYRPPGNHFSIVLSLAHPLSRGSVHITSSEPDSARGNGGLVINPRYLSHPLDLEVLALHIRFIDESICHAEPLASRLKDPQKKLFTDMRAARDYVKRTSKGQTHYMGTCSMMSRELGGVVDEKLRVYGCPNLRVCDASIVLIIPRTNAQATVYGVAEMAASLIKESL
ncbi:Uu.00g072540.m01.CDS01 [Anthostomella pinea]|uniref:Uu.00g072540.m01.CDS01 n=1 Tax=Anthostomella pinea TaxID=933095 RepID=A0AAI8YNR3_9PEZI|nr:Uu.00g072540.m01.CDS01 [Anthostomella pinea]